MTKAKLTLILLAILFAGTIEAEIKSEVVNYSDGETALQGNIYWDDAVEGKRPAILVVHEWWGLNDYARHRAKMLARRGYVTFAADMYGKGKLTTHPKEAGEWSTSVRSNQELWQRRANLALDQLRAHAAVDAAQLAAIGYCFGGATVMQLAYSGADVKGVVSFSWLAAAGHRRTGQSDKGQNSDRAWRRGSLHTRRTRYRVSGGARASRSGLANDLLRRCTAQLHRSSC